MPRRRQNEQKHDTAAHRSLRLKSTCRRKEQLRDTAAHRVSRVDHVYRRLEQVRDKDMHRIKREDPNYVTQENEYRNLRENNNRTDWNKVKQVFFDNILHGHTNICSCCGRL